MRRGGMGAVMRQEPAQAKKGTPCERSRQNHSLTHPPERVGAEGAQMGVTLLHKSSEKGLKIKKIKAFLPIFEGTP